MMHFITIGTCFLMISLVAIFSPVAGETMKEIQGNFMKTTPRSTESYTLEGTLLKIEEEFWLLEDRFGDQHRLQIGAETRLPQAPKQTGDSIHAVIRNDGHAWVIQ